MKSKLAANQVVKNAHKLRENLNASEIKLKDKSNHRLPVDLTDVYTICVDCKYFIEQLMKEETWIDTEKLRKIIHQIQIQLFQHLPYHYKPLKKTLEKIYWQITTDDDVERDMNEMLSEIDEFFAKSREKENKKNTNSNLCLPEKKKS